jgi:glycosyltransferase involved in cell wall biosynthesis
MIKKILVIASYADSLINFRFQLLNKFVERGYNVIACAPNASKETIDKLSSIGVKHREIILDRQGINPLKDLIAILHIFKIIYSEKPEKVFCYTIKPVIYGSLVSSLLGVKYKYSIITGIGYALYNFSFKQKIIGIIVKLLYKFALKRNSSVFFQNPDDIKLFKDNKIIDESTKIKLINGSGVDLDYFYKSKPNLKPCTFLLIARLLKEKGVVEFINAAKNIKKKYPQSIFQLIGWSDASPSTIDLKIIKEAESQGTIVFLGFKKDVRKYLKNASVFVLPSYREGTPRTVLEAMSMCRPIITTDSPGCRETVENNINGFLVPIRNSELLEESMEKFIINPSLIKDMGIKSREIAEKKYDVKKVNKSIILEMGIK